MRRPAANVSAVSVAVLLLAMAAGVGTRPRSAAACTLAPFTLDTVASHVLYADVVAIGAFGRSEGAAIAFSVEEYFKAPPGGPPEVWVNNLVQDLMPNCDTVPRRLRRFQEGTRAVVFLSRDEQGVGADWRDHWGILPIESGTVQIREVVGDRIPNVSVSIERFRTELVAAAGQPIPPAAGRAPQPPPSPTSPVTCVYDRPSPGHLARDADLVVRGVVTSVTEDTATLRVDEVLKGAPGLSVQVNNHDFDGALTRCAEEMRPVGGRFRTGDRLLAFLRRDLLGRPDWRAVWVDGVGIFIERPEQPVPYIDYQTGLAMTLEEARAAAQSVAAPAGPAAESGPPPTVQRERNPLWLAAVAFAAVTVGAGFFLAIRWRRHV